jgi:hypothetical protein
MIVRPINEADARVWAELRAQLWPGDGHIQEISRFFLGQVDDRVLA